MFLRHLMLIIAVCDLFSLYLAPLIVGGFVNLFQYGAFYQIYWPMPILVVIMLHNMHHYETRLGWCGQISGVLLACLCGFLVDGFLCYATQCPLPRLWLVCVWFGAVVVVLCVRWIIQYMAITHNVWSIPTTLIGDHAQIEQNMPLVMEQNTLGYHIDEIITRGDRNIDLSDSWGDITQYHVQNLALTIKDIDKKRLVLVACETENMDDILKTLSYNNIAYAIISNLKQNSKLQFCQNISIVWPLNFTARGVEMFVKRVMDITISMLLLILGMPLFLLIMLLISYDNGPILYSQIRIGKHGRNFRMWKFRSMCVDADKQLNHILETHSDLKKQWQRQCKLVDDPRVTRLGRLLRRYSLDEFPQLINVLKGHMSLIGPRPILPNETSYFTVEQLNIYYSVKPGISGLWQISGRNYNSFIERIQLDNYYVKNWCLWHDVVILIRTVCVVVRGCGSW